MVSANIQRILEEAAKLSSDERAELIKRLSGTGKERNGASLGDLLSARGILSSAPSRGMDAARYSQWKPIAVAGRPVSETIIHERR